METNANQTVSCVVNYGYEAMEPDELTLRPGDIVRDVDRLSGGWWRGELRGRRGMFPDNFVSVYNDQASNRSSTIQGRCKAVFAYQPANPDELPLAVGDVLDVLSEVEEGWWQGRRQGRVGVFPSNFVVMLDAPTNNAALPPYSVDPVPILPPKPVKEQCRVLFPYTAVNEDELTLTEGDIVTIVSKDAPDRGWWKGELHGKVGLFPDNFVQIINTGSPEVEEKKPDKPPPKNLYPIINKYSEKTSSIKELTTSKTSLHKDPSNKDSNAPKESTVSQTNKSDFEKITHSETVHDGSIDGQLKKPPLPIKKSPTPASGVGSLFSGLKNIMMSDKDKSSTSSTASNEDKTDGAALSTTNNNTFDHVERNSILNDPRASRVKAPRRRPPSQAVTNREDTPTGLSNGHEVTPEKSSPAEKNEEIKPKAREWEKRRAPWMEELKLNQAKKTGHEKSTGSTDRILEVGLEEKKSSSHSMEMSKSTSSISSRISVLESFEETKVRSSLDSKKEEKITNNSESVTTRHSIHSPTAAGRTLTTMLDEIKKPPAPSPPVEKRTVDVPKTTEPIRTNSAVFEKPSAVSERVIFSFSEKVNEEKPVDKMEKPLSSTLERKSRRKTENSESELITQLNDRIINLEKLLEVQNAKFTAAIDELNAKLSSEIDKRVSLQTEVEKLAHCVTQV